MRDAQVSIVATATLLALFGGVAARDIASDVVASYRLADTPLAAFNPSITNDRGIYLGSIGSDLWHGAGDASNEFWMITDRGPNGQVKVGKEKRRTFAVPEFIPSIVHVRTEGRALTVTESLPIVGQSGVPASGLPNIEGHDEVPYDFRAEQILAYDPNGVDTEGLVRTPVGDFWATEEYGPSVLHIDSAGHVLQRFMPHGLNLTGADYPVTDSLPAIFAHRKSNRGFEGLGLAVDGTSLYLAMQSPLSHPDKKTGEASRACRILIFDIASGRATAEYVYLLDDPNAGLEQDDITISGLAVAGPSSLLVLERTDHSSRIYNAELAGASNILGSAWDDVTTSPTLESLNDLSQVNIAPVAKKLLLNIGAIPGMAEKLEGIAILDSNTIAVANDNDFDLGSFDASGRNLGHGAKNQLLIVRTPPIR